MRYRGNARGLALIIVVGVLGLLAALAMAFTTLAQLERRASRQRLNVTKATLLARSGIEDAMARIGAGQDADLPENRYRGEDWDADGSLSTYEAAQEVYRPTGAGTTADADACPVRHALRPSFYVRDPGVVGNVPDKRLAGGRDRGLSGMLSGGQIPGGNQYALKVTPQAGIFLNGGDPAQAPLAGDYNTNLRRMLGVLAEAVDRDPVAGVPGANDGSPVDQLDGARLIDLRPRTSRGWESWDQVRDLAFQGDLPPVRQAKLDALKPYLSLHARVDRKVIRPHAPATTGDVKSWADIKLARPAGLYGKEPGFERIPVTSTGKIVGRAPVDLAWARTRRPVLIALLADIGGAYLNEGFATPIFPPFVMMATFTTDVIGRVRGAEILLNWNTPTDGCLLAADRILASTSELKTWDQWNAFCDSIPFPETGWTASRRSRQDLLKANFNPNSDLNKFSPNASLWKCMDKSDLRVWSTEFSLLPQASAQELECVGRVLGRDGRVLASRVLGATIAPAGLLTLTTQKEFVCGDLGDPFLAGDEGTPRLPGAPAFISQNMGTGEKTWGHALGLGGLGTSGASLQTYPEPCVDARTYPQSPPAVLSIRPADYDGSVQLATIETQDDYTYSVTAASPLDMKLLARYTAGLDLDVADAAPTRPLAPLAEAQKWRNQPDIQQVTYNSGGSPNLPQLGNGLLHATRPNTLYPDGVYSERLRAPSYLSSGNAHGLHGLISFWVKPNYSTTSLYPAGTSRGHPFFRFNNFMGPYSVLANASQFFCLSGLGSGIGCFFELGHSTAEIQNEYQFSTGGGMSSRRWSLITMYYDFLSPSDQHDCGELLVNAGSADADKGSNDRYEGGFDGPAPSMASDITVSDDYGAHRLFLGVGARPQQGTELPKRTGFGADATFDELAIYDFGGATYVSGISTTATTGTLASPGLLASARFEEGRYYRESDYAGLAASADANKAARWFSAPIDLGGPRRIKALAWTQVVPRGLKAPLPAAPNNRPGIDGDAGPDGAILMELADASLGAYLQDAFGQPINRTFSNSESSRVDRAVSAPFRLHAVFRPNLELSSGTLDTPILDPLALDDVTVVYEPLGGRRILAWGQGEE